MKERGKKRKKKKRPPYKQSETETSQKHLCNNEQKMDMITHDSKEKIHMVHLVGGWDWWK